MKKKTAPKKKASRVGKPKHRSLLKEFLVALGITVVLVVATSNIPTTTVLGTHNTQNVLGDDDENKEEEHKEDNSGSSNKEDKEEEKKEEEHKEEDKKEEEKQEENDVDNSSEAGSTTTTQVVNSKTKSTTQSEEQKQETEIETATGQKIKTKVEDDGTTKIEIEEGGRKVKYVVENGKVVLKIENESGEDHDATEEELEDIHDELEQEFENHGIDIATSEGKIKFVKNNVSAQSNFPLSVNIDTNQLIVSTPNGDKVVAILPDQAVLNLINTGVIYKVEGASTTDNLETDVTLEEKDGEVVYRVKGVKTKRLLGLIPVDTKVTAFISAENGVPVATEQSLFSNIINSISL